MQAVNRVGAIPRTAQPAPRGFMSSADSTVATPSIYKAVVPAAGLGTRLRPLTHVLPKELLPLGREPVLTSVVTELRAAGITQALFVVSERKPQIRSYFGELYTGDNTTLPPLQCDYILQPQQRGSGDAVLCAQEWVGNQPFVVAFGDCLIDSAELQTPLCRMLATHQAHSAIATVLVEPVAREKVCRYGVVAPLRPLEAEPLDPFALSGVVEKPKLEEAPSNLAVAARWVLAPAIFPALQQAGSDALGEVSIPDAMPALLRSAGSAWAVPLRAGEHRRDIGDLESYLAEFVRAALRDPDYGASARHIAAEELKGLGK